MNPLTLEWIVKAVEDYLVAKREREEAAPALNAVCFHCQQCEHGTKLTQLDRAAGLTFTVKGFSLSGS